MISFIVGKKFPLKINILYPGDFYYFNVIDNNVLLAYFFGNPSFDEIGAMKKGQCQFAVTEMDGIVFFLSKVGTMNWSDVAINHHMISDEFTMVPSEGYGYPIHVMMVDRNTNLIKVMRTVGVSSSFSKELKYLLEKNIACNFDDSAYRQKTLEIHSRYSTTDLLNKSIVYLGESCFEK